MCKSHCAFKLAQEIVEPEVHTHAEGKGLRLGFSSNVDTRTTARKVPRSSRDIVEPVRFNLVGERVLIELVADDK